MLGRVAQVITPEGKLSVAYHGVGELQGEVKKVTFPNGNVYSSEDPGRLKIALRLVASMKSTVQ